MGGDRRSLRAKQTGDNRRGAYSVSRYLFVSALRQQPAAAKRVIT